MFVKGVTFAAASIAEGAVRFVGDIAMSVSEMFATESQHALESGLTPKEKRHMLDIATIESTKQSGLHTDHLDTLVINDTAKLDGSPLVESQMNDDNDQSYFFLWAMNNVDDIMADTLGVGSLAPELIGVFVVCYLSSLILLRRQRSKDNRLVEHGKPPEKPSHISVPKEQVRAPHEPFTHDTHNDTDSHTTLTVDWTTKVETRQMRSSYVKRIAKGIFFVVLSPMKLFVLAAGWVWSLVFNRKSILLLLYSGKFAQVAISSSFLLFSEMFLSYVVVCSGVSVSLSVITIQGCSYQKVCGRCTVFVVNTTMSVLYFYLVCVQKIRVTWLPRRNRIHRSISCVLLGVIDVVEYNLAQCLASQ